MIYLGIVEQEKIDRLVTMHTSIPSGDIWCKNQISPALPLGARSLTEGEEEEEEEDYDEKIRKSRMRKICSSGNTKVSTSLEDIARATDGSVNRSGVLLRLNLSFPGVSDGRVVGDHVRSHPRHPYIERLPTL